VYYSVKRFRCLCALVTQHNHTLFVFPAMGSAHSVGRYTDKKLRTVVTRKIFIQKRQNPEYRQWPIAKYLEHVFRGIDVDQSGELSMSEFSSYTRKFGIVLPDEVIAVIFERFDKDVSESISIYEFIKFLSPNDAEAYTPRPVEIPQEEEGKMQEEKEWESPREPSEDESPTSRAKRLYHDEQRRVSEIEFDIGTSGRRIINQASEDQKKIERLEKLLADTQARCDSLRGTLNTVRSDMVNAFNPAILEKKRQSNLRMKKRKKTEKRLLNRIASKRLLRELTQDTALDKSDVMSMRKLWLSKQGPETELTLEHFIEIMLTTFPDFEKRDDASDILQRLFVLFDTDSDGVLSFKEFIFGMSMTMESSVEEKAKLIFEFYDANGDGNIKLSELLKMVDAGKDNVMEHLGFLRDLLLTMDEDGSGDIDREEFISSLCENETLRDSFGAVLPFNSAVKAVQDNTTGFSFSSVHKLWKKLGFRGEPISFKPGEKGGRKKGKHMITFAEFNDHMVKEFGCDPNSGAFLKSIFESVDVDASGTVDFRELLRGFSVMMTATPDEQLKYSFNMFGKGASKKLDIDKLNGLLKQRGKSLVSLGFDFGFGGLAMKTIDGKISYDDFMQQYTLLDDDAKQSFVHVLGSMTGLESRG